MSTATQYNPNVGLNKRLLAIGASKTVYALVTPETEATKAMLFGSAASPLRTQYLDMFRDAWTSKQDQYHEEFFNTWAEWSAPVVDLDRTNFPFFYPTNGASEPIRHIIYDWASQKHGSISLVPRRIHVFEGEYEGYKAMAESAGLEVWEHKREDWRTVHELVSRLDLFFISQPSAIDGNVWKDFNAFAARMPVNSIVADITYVGGVPKSAIGDRIELNHTSIRNIIFSLSKPFGVYYDRIGGVFFREEDPGLFGNKWFKNLTSLKLGTLLMQNNGVFDLPEKYAEQQRVATEAASKELGFALVPSDVYILAGVASSEDSDMANYLRRAGRIRVCVTAGMSRMIGTTSETINVL